MSNEQQIYIGAYLAVKRKPYNEHEAEDECPEHGDISHIARNANFCPTCGEKIIKMYHNKEKYHSFYDITDDDSLMEAHCHESSNDMMYLVSNEDDGTHHTFDKGDEGIFDLSSPDHYVDLFCTSHKDMIQRLRNHENIESVKCFFGAVIYWY